MVATAAGRASALPAVEASTLTAPPTPSSQPKVMGGKAKVGSQGNAHKNRKSRESNENAGGSLDLNLSIESAMKQLQEIKDHRKK